MTAILAPTLTSALMAALTSTLMTLPAALRLATLPVMFLIILCGGGARS
jgi:uncharacterized membrane protein